MTVKLQEDQGMQTVNDIHFVQHATHTMNCYLNIGIRAIHTLQCGMHSLYSYINEIIHANNCEAIRAWFKIHSLYTNLVDALSVQRKTNGNRDV